MSFQRSHSSYYWTNGQFKLYYQIWWWHISIKKKHAYYGQVQLGMVMLNVGKCDVVIYSTFSNAYISLEILLDTEFTKKMLISLKNAYFTNMIHNIICRLIK